MAGRPAGKKNPQHQQRRAELAARALTHLLSAKGGVTSLNQLAAAAGTGVPTINHYFGGRAGLVAAALRSLAAGGEEHIAKVRVPSSSDLAVSLRDFASFLRMGWQDGVDRVVAIGMAIGIDDATAGPAYVDAVLEPLLQAFEARLRLHAERGEADVPESELRTAALAFVSPLVLALLHQGPLSGVTCRPLDLDHFLDVHVARFVRAWGSRG